MKRLVVLLVCLLWTQPALAQKTKRPMQIEDLFRFQRLADPQVSPDGSLVAYVVTSVDLAGNRSSSSIWIAPTGKGEPRPLTSTTKKDSHPRWSPDGKRILFASNRSGDSQLWTVQRDGGEPQQVTSISTGASTGTWSRDGKHIAFVSAVWPEFASKTFKDSDALNKQRTDERAKSPVKARVFTRLFFRHWDDYVEDKRQHLFVMSFDDGKAGEPRDVTPVDRDAYPTSTTFSLGDDFTFSPDGKHLVFTAVPEKDEAWSTDYDVCRVPVAGGKIECLTVENGAADGAPQFSPDGKWLAYRAQKRPGHEADRWELMILPTDRLDDVVRAGISKGKNGKDKDDGKKKENGKKREEKPKVSPRSITTEFEGSVEAFQWLPNSEDIYLASEHRARTMYFRANVNDTEARLTFISHHTNDALSCSKDGKVMAFTRAALHHPPEVFVSTEVKGDFVVRNVSKANTKLLAELDLPEPDSVMVNGAGGVPMQMWILKPPGFDARKKWPLAFLVHGGPQSAWADGWSFRWNAQAWAAQGYVVALPNPRGSTGFGQQYVDEISGDWGGKCYEDLIAGLAHLEKQPYIDPERMASAGASFGGYMMNWFQGHTTKFKTLITHCGVYNFESMYGTTEELWFDEWEHKGTPWQQSESYKKHSPHLYAKNFKTPMLVIHNDLDFRVPVSEGIQLFTALQRLGVPSRMINFPGENHWVLKPANSRYWHEEVFGWLKKYVPAGGK